MPSESGNAVDDVYISKLEMATRMDVSSRTIEIWMRGNKVPYIKIGRTVRFHWGDVRAFLARQNSSVAPADNQLRPHEGVRAQMKQLAASIRNEHRLATSKP